MGEMKGDMMDNCIFCKIADGKIPCAKVYEDRETLAFLDIGPFNKGHVLVIPKKHYRWVWDIEAAEASRMMPKLAKIAAAVKKATSCDIVMLVTMGDEVEHAHYHLVPKFDGDRIHLWSREKYGDGEIAEFAEKIKNSI